jgi:1,4-dihydroxy-2-naphthoate octaprenyltransferase
MACVPWGGLEGSPPLSEMAFSDHVRNWAAILRTQNLPGDAKPDPVSLWLLITRASVFPMTLTSGLIGGLLASGHAAADWRLFSLALFGLVVAHAANNMINDWFDLGAGVDTSDYVRAQYSPHPILSGLVSKQTLGWAIALANLVDLVILWRITQERGPLVIAFALAGLFVSVFYVAPPVRLKHRGLGEPAVGIVWGPLMVGGTYFVTTGTSPGWVFMASVPYALLVTTVLFGKHVDKLPADAGKGIRTLPVILGERISLAVTRAMVLAFYVTVVTLVLGGVLGVWALLVLLAAPRGIETMRILREPRPARPPEGYPIWPLWYVAWAFRHTRRAGALLVAGIAVNALMPWYL